MTKTEKQQLHDDLITLILETELPGDKRTRVGNELKRWRFEARMNSEEVANKVGICPATLYNYESGASKISLENAYKLIKLYNAKSGKRHTLDALAAYLG